MTTNTIEAIHVPVTLTVGQINLINTKLSEYPYKDVATLILTLKVQAEQHIAAVAKREAEQNKTPSEQPTTERDSGQDPA